MQTELQEFFENSQKALKNMLLRNAPSNLGPKYTMRKVEPWGEMVNQTSFNFEFPDQKQFAIWHKKGLQAGNVELKSIEFKNVNGIISSARCKYSDDTLSPLIEKTIEFRDLHRNKETVVFPKGIRKVVAASNANPWTHVSVQEFYDEDNKKVAEYNPIGHKFPERELLLRENESLFGIYGVLGKQNWFTTFGYIIKVTNY